MQHRTPPRARWIVVGLGNPGARFSATRHNVGFEVVARVARQARLEFGRAAAECRIAEGRVADVPVAIVRPQTFMNDSGRAVGRLIQRYRLTPGELIVITDDVDLGLGRLRIRPQGGSGTHNGMRSIVAEIGEGFPRIRVGVAPQGAAAGIDDLAEYVLAPFSPEEREAADAAVARAAEAVLVTIRDGLRRAMDQFNA